MNKYTKLSDLEINKKVAEHLGDSGNWFELSDFDPCNNPADAMPIIIENNISITLSDDKGEGKWMAFDGDWYDEYSLSRTSVSYGDNYYRIAMEVYLLMNGK